MTFVSFSPSRVNLFWKIWKIKINATSAPSNNYNNNYRISFEIIVIYSIFWKSQQIWRQRGQFTFWKYCKSFFLLLLQCTNKFEFPARFARERIRRARCFGLVWKTHLQSTFCLCYGRLYIQTQLSKKVPFFKWWKHVNWVFCVNLKS